MLTRKHILILQACLQKKFDSNELFRANAPALPLMTPAPSMTSYPNTASIQPVNNHSNHAPAPSMTSYPGTASMQPVNNNSNHTVRNHQETSVPQSTSNGSSSSSRQPCPTVPAPVHQHMAALDSTVEIKRDQQEDSFISCKLYASVHGINL